VPGGFALAAALLYLLLPLLPSWPYRLLFSISQNLAMWNKMTIAVLTVRKSEGWPIGRMAEQ
jgi:hypothetical protein